MACPDAADVPARKAAEAIALVALPGMTPAQLTQALHRWPDPGQALDRVCPDPAAARRRAEAVSARRATRVFLATDEGFPIVEDLPGRPALLFAEGDQPAVLDAPRVAIVGTRAATPHGLSDARTLGAFLAGHGVSVVSGLAIGIDAAAHEGALSTGQEARGGPIGVVATGLDVVYPRRHQDLFARVRRRGLLVSECAYGVQPAPGRFPVRNRIIAGLADVVVVIEATLTGGSRITAERALDYGRPVFALPGSRRNPAAAGCNALLADGAQPLLHPSDILIALRMTSGDRRGWDSPARRPTLSKTASAVERALAGEPAHPDELASRTGLRLDALAVALDELIDAGRAQRSRGYVWPI